MTVYRVGDDTPFVQSLIRAAEAGKQVACVIELNARFDEERNLHWSRELEKVGAHVVLRSERAQDAQQDRARRAQGGRRHALLRAHRDRQLPHAHGEALRGRRAADGRPGDHERRRHALPLPHRPLADAVVRDAARRADATCARSSSSCIEREIENHEAGRPARIVCKMNQLEDPEICAAARRGRRRPECRST